MIVEVDSSVVGALNESNANGHEMIELFSDILTSISRGTNLYRIKKKDLLLLSEDARLSDYHKSIAKIESANATFRESLDDIFDFKIKLYHSNHLSSLAENDINIDVKEYRKLKERYNIYFLDRPVVVFENLNDNRVYRKIADGFLSSNKEFKGLRIIYEPYPGGGDTTHVVCRSLINEGRIVFSLVDSDKKHPYDNVGKTANDTIGVFDKKNSVLVVGVHEVENLIPHEVLERVSRKEQAPLVEFLKVASSICDEAPKFYDLKESFSFYSIFENQNSTFAGYWKPIFEKWNPNYEADFRGLVESGDRKLSDKVLNKLSSMLPHAVDSFSDSDLSACPSYISDEWKRIGQFLLCCGVSSRPITI